MEIGPQEGQRNQQPEPPRGAYAPLLAVDIDHPNRNREEQQREQVRTRQKMHRRRPNSQQRDDHRP